MAPILVGLGLVALLIFYLMTILDLERQRFHPLCRKAQLLTLIWLFPIGGVLYYWTYKKQLIQRP